MNYEKSAGKEIIKRKMLTSALVGSGMAIMLLGKVFHSHGYEFSTVGPSLLLVWCLWWPYLESLSLTKKEK